MARTSKQRDRVRERLDRGLPITSLDGFTKLGIVHLPGVIRDLKKEGFPIVDRYVKGRNRWGEPVSFKQWRKAPEPEQKNLI